eukprot:scaffold455765_cov37-Prasinocladus_malaysianus.AAC.1
MEPMGLPLHTPDPAVACRCPAIRIAPTTSPPTLVFSLYLPHVQHLRRSRLRYITSLPATLDQPTHILIGGDLQGDITSGHLKPPRMPFHRLTPANLVTFCPDQMEG